MATGGKGRKGIGFAAALAAGVARDKWGEFSDSFRRPLL